MIGLLIGQYASPLNRRPQVAPQILDVNALTHSFCSFWRGLDCGATTTFLGKEFVLGEGLWLDSDRLFGTGTLSGLWLDGTSWTTQINGNASTATILLIPEPCTLLLLGVGGVMIRKRIL